MASKSKELKKDSVIIYRNYEELIEDKNVDAIYIPLPNSLHFEWAKKSLIQGKHVIVEKPLCVTLQEAIELTNLAESNNCVLMETFQFRFHKQFKFIKEILKEKKLGSLKKIDIKFGIPELDKNNIRYDSNLLGGSFYDLGVYGLKIISELFSYSFKITNYHLNKSKQHDVDISGGISFMVDDIRLPINFDFGFDHEYICNIEIWGSIGLLKNERIFTAPANEKIITDIKTKNNLESYVFSDDQIRNLFCKFAMAIKNKDNGFIKNEYENILKQANLVEKTYKLLNGND